MIGIGLRRPQLIFSWGGNPGVGSLHRFRDAVEHGLAGAARDRGALARGHGGRLRRRRRQPALRRAARLRRHRPAGPHARRRRGSTARSRASGWRPCGRCAPTSASSTPSGRTRAGNVQLWGISGVQKEAVLASARSIVTVEEIVAELTPHARRRHPAELGGDGGRRRARRRAPVLRPRLLRPRQRLLPALGRDQPRPRAVPGVDARGTCWRRPASRSTARASWRRPPHDRGRLHRRPR